MLTPVPSLNVQAERDSRYTEFGDARKAASEGFGTNGTTWHFGVGCPVLSDFKRGCDGELPDSVSLIMPVDRVIADRRKKYEETGDPKHLNYEKSFKRELKKKGRQNPEIRRNYYLEDTVEEGNFISRDRLLSCARGPEVVVPMDHLFFGVDWARLSDFTWVTIVNDKNDVIDWIKYPHISYPDQVALIKADMAKDRGGCCYRDRIIGVRGDATGGSGDAPNEILQMESGLPVGEDSFFTFSTQGKDRLYVNFETVLFKETTDPLRFSYPADHPLAAEFEEQMVALIRKYLQTGEYLSVHHPKDVQDAKDDAPDSTALAVLGAAGGGIGEIVFV